MKFNKQELSLLASQPSSNFDREGLLVLKERQEKRFFRRSESLKAVPELRTVKDGKRESLSSLNCVNIIGKVNASRWFRLRGNLLFYMKGIEQWSEAMGVLILEQHSVRMLPQDESGLWPIAIALPGPAVYQVSALSHKEQIDWVQSLTNASCTIMQNQLKLLKEKIAGLDEIININTWRIKNRIITDVSEVPMCEVSISCDNLLCDSYGKPPSPLVCVYVTASNGRWIHYSNTEVIQHCSNPTFCKTISFRASDGLSHETVIRIIVEDMRELVSRISVPLGQVKLLLRTIQETQRLRIALKSADDKTVGFITLNGWSLEPSTQSSSPKHAASANNNKIEASQKILSHRRSHSLPPRLGVKLKLPTHGPGVKNIFNNVHQVTYRFHSGLGGDISVQEMMAESKLCFHLPMQFLEILISNEKELLQEIICLGELGEPWKCRQMELIDSHLSLLKNYCIARQKMHNLSKKKFIKESAKKAQPGLEFAPVNLHLQRMWAHNDTLNKSEFHDIITVGAFTAHTLRAEEGGGGLLASLRKLKDLNSKSECAVPTATRIQMAFDNVQAIKQLRHDVVNIMIQILHLAEVKETTGMLALADEIISKSKTLLSLWDSDLVEEALTFIECYRAPVVPEPAPMADVPPGRPQTLSPFSQLTAKLKQLNLKSPELEDFATPCTPVGPDTLLHAITQPSATVKVAPASLEQLQNMKIAKEASLYANLDRFQSYNFHKASSDHANSEPIEYSSNNREHRPIFTNDSLTHTEGPKQSLKPQCEVEDAHSLLFQMSLEDNGYNEPAKTPKEVANSSEEESVLASSEAQSKKYFDLQAMSSSPSANYYRPSDEPEPWDLTQLNIEASVMCLVSKVKFLCGHSGSPAVRLREQRPPLTDRRFGDLPNAFCRPASDATRKDQNQRRSSQGSGLGAEVTNGDGSTSHKDVLHCNKDLPEKVAKREKKGNKFTDGMKLSEVREWAGEVRPAMRKLRGALDGLLKSGRVAHAALRLRGRAPLPAAELRLRRDICLSHALTAAVSGLMCWLWSSDEEVLNKVFESGLGPLIGFEGLLSIFQNEKVMWGDMVVAIEDLHPIQFTLVRSNHNTNMMPQIYGSRQNLEVLLPAPDSLYDHLVSKKMVKFAVTAVFFNIGVNSKAVLADPEDTLQQDKSNMDNYEKLNSYYYRYRKTFTNSGNNLSRASSRQRPLDDVMENLRMEIQRLAAKNIEVLKLATLATRQMNGIRVTSCKSAKDRTGMSCTLEQCHILVDEYHMADNEFQKAMDCMRSEGCRIENTFKNIGVRKYAFDKVQRQHLPTELRPPTGTYGCLPT